MIPGFGQRLREARLQTAVRIGRTVSQGEMARFVTLQLAKLGSSKTVSQPQWSDYEAEKSEPSGIVYRAAYQISGLTEGYLAFGNGGAVVLDPSQIGVDDSPRREARQGRGIPAPRPEEKKKRA